MVDISVRELTKEFEVGSRVLDGLSFQIDSGERVGILGKNGAGKTTLFRILTGEERADAGEVSIASGKRLGLISQIPVYPADYTVEDVLETAFLDLREMEGEMGRLAAAMREHSDVTLLRRYDALAAAFEAGGGYETDTRLGKVCNGLGIPPEMRGVAFMQLSGGEKTRVNLARLLLVDTDILLLDEPTNHLDLKATQWLEEYLGKYKGTVLAISHDRYFLDRVITRVIELREGKAELYHGNYSFYAIEKEKRYLEQLRQYEKEQAKLKQLQTAADKLHLWAFMGNDKLHKRAFSIEKRMERLQTTDRPRQERTLALRFGEKQFHGDDLFVLENLAKSFGQRRLFAEVSLRIEEGDRIALLGDNGTGKSTLLKILMEEEPVEEGRIRKGPTVSMGYLPQQIHFSHPERSLLDTMLYEQNCSTQEARDRLAAFQFRGEDVFKEVRSLSGGEQSRLRLCMLMNARINLLILDEPTNHLDLRSREWIESSVEDYDGALLFVSHDRYFINRFANRIWTLEDGTIFDYRGDYASYQAMLERKRQQPALVKEAGNRADKAPRSQKGAGGGTKQLKKDLAVVEKRLEKAEERLEALKEEKNTHATDYQALEEIMAREAEVMEDYEALFSQWEALTGRLEQLETGEGGTAALPK
jgi:ATPase subunit of ABC transporter with duplicated ATPase domains